MGRMRFEWDENKNRQNQEKHTIAFEAAQYAFADPHRVIAKDLPHSQDEQRHYCFGKVGLAFLPCGLPTEVTLFVLSALGTGGKENRFMKKKITYTDEPLGDIQVVEDFLPPPEQLVFKEENVKVTLSLSKSSVNFFKQTAAANHVSYQQMIRRLLDLYVARHQQ